MLSGVAISLCSRSGFSQDVAEDQLFAHPQSGKLAHERITESIELISTELKPKYW
jgi:hypothetical protein